ncbi:unnamed protein product [Rotaria socialis]|uniref:Uncharacterized protein n=1 Tax=Rotaria socialis TaxID=392032 RepID=A0A818SDA2_9BILA|nr:unnamed protein product [Rotaria socialis]
MNFYEIVTCMIVLNKSLKLPFFLFTGGLLGTTTGGTEAEELDLDPDLDGEGDPDPDLDLENDLDRDRDADDPE